MEAKAHPPDEPNEAQYTSKEDRLPAWTRSVGEKGDIFHIVHDENTQDTSNRLLPVGSLHEVVLSVDSVKGRSRLGDTECERLFGIIPAKFNKTTPTGHIKSFVRVAAIIPGRESYHTQVSVNDWLMCVNDLEVTWDNLDSILSAVTSPKQSMITDNKKVLLTRPYSGGADLVHPVISSGETNPHLNHQQQFLTVMYMTLDSTEESSSNDLLYCFPKEGRDSNKLVAVRGMFLTLSNVMSDIASHPAKISSVMCDGKLVHMAYAQNGRQLLVLAAPSEEVSNKHLLNIMQNTTRCLTYMFSSLHCALSERENLHRVNLFFTLLSQQLLGSSANPEQPFDSLYYMRSDLEKSYDTMMSPAVTLLLPDESKINVDNTLSEFEAGDFGDMSDDYYDMRRAYTILGSCLFYKSYLVANHLPTEDMLDISLYASRYNILTMSRLSPLGGSMIWQEVFPTRRQKQEGEEQDMFYVEVHGRYFLLIVAHNHSILGVLLEAGGCAARAIGNPVADTFYVSQARQTLRQLETFDFSLICEARLQTSRPPLTSIDNIQTGNKSALPGAGTIAKGLLARAGTTAAEMMKRAAGSATKSKGVRQSTEQTNTNTGFLASLDRLDLDAQSHDSGVSPPHTPSADSFKRSRNMSLASTGSGDSNNSVNNQLYNKPRGRTIVNTESATPKRGGETSGDNISNMSASISAVASSHNNKNSFMLTSGEENTLFDYISFDSVLGVVISPALDELHIQGSGIHKKVLQCFYSTCISIRNLFQSSQTKEPEVSSIHEHGVLFQIPPASDSSKKSHNFWVVGRRFTRPVIREFYVCHHESVTENMVSLAFKMNTGFLI